MRGPGQRTQQQLPYAGTEGVRTRWLRDRGEHPAEDDLREMLRLRIPLDRGLDQAHHGQLGASHREMAGQAEGLGGGEGTETEDQFLGRELFDLASALLVEGRGRRTATEPGDGAGLPARVGQQRRPVRQPGRRGFQNGEREDTGRKILHAVRVHVVRRVGRRGRRRDDLCGRGRQRGGAPQALGERLDHCDRHPRRPAPQRAVPAGARGAVPPLWPHAVADQERDGAAVRVRLLGAGAAYRAVGFQAVQLHRAEDSRLGQRRVQFTDERPPDRHGRARVVHEVQGQPAFGRRTQHGKPPPRRRAEPCDPMRGRLLVELLPDGRGHPALEGAQGALQREGWVSIGGAGASIEVYEPLGSFGALGPGSRKGTRPSGRRSGSGGGAVSGTCG